MKPTTVPQPMHQFCVTEDDLAAIATRLVEQTRTSVDKVLSSVNVEQATFDNVMIPIAHMENDLAHEAPYLMLLENVSPLANIRKAAATALRDTETAWDVIYENQSLFSLVDAVKSRCPQNLDEESTRLLEDVHVGYINRGLNLGEEARMHFSAMKKRRTDLRTAFVKNLGTDPGSLWIHEDELRGLSKAALESLERDERGQRRIVLRSVSTSVILQECSNEKTRKDVFVAMEKVYADNAALLREAVLLRDEGARLLGYSSYQHQMVSRRMMKNPGAVTALLQDMHTRLQPLVHQEIKGLKELRGDGKEIYLWDWPYYHARMLEKNDVNQGHVAEYFPADHVLPQMLEIFEELFHLDITELPDRSDSQVWHKDVQVFSVKDLVDGSFVGYLYMDLYPRDGKYSNNADFNVRPSYLDRAGVYVTSATALICNVTPPSGDLPALLQYRNVITVFHELGHGMHDLLGRTRFSQYHGWSGRRDFTETPSQLLEFWCWVPDVIKRMSCHYSYLSEESLAHWKRMNPDATEQPPKQMPDGMSKALEATKYMNEAIATGRQVGLSLFDCQIHNPSSHEELEQMDIAREYYTILASASGIRGPEDGSVPGNGHSRTTHFMWGQEANYYSYVSTRILAADIWKTCFSQNPMDPKAGLRYRQMVLDKGGSADEARMVAALLGREPNNDAFLDDIIGINARSG